MSGIMSNFFGGSQGGRVTHTVQQPEDSGQGNGNGSGNGNPTPEEEEEEVSPLQALYSEEEPEEDDDDPENPPQPELGPDGKPKKTREQEVAARVQAIISKINVAEDMIPADFDPTDPKQFRDVLGKVQQNTALATMSAMMEPMRVSMESLAQNVKDQIGAALKDFGMNNQSKGLLESTVPEVLDPEYTGLVNALHEQAKKKHKKPADAVRAVRSAVDALGLPKKKGGDSDPSQGASLKGNDALNLFAPLTPKK